MRDLRRATVVLALATVIAFGCTPGPSPAPSAAASNAHQSPSPTAPTGIRPILVSSEVVVGPNRFLFSLIDAANNLVAAPDVPVAVQFYDLAADPAAVVFEDEARFIWAIEDARGLYVVDADFPNAGRWAAELTAQQPQGQAQVRVEFEVAAEGSTPGVGEPAVSVDTPTATDVGGDLAQLTSDDDPNPRFYRTAVDEAVSAGAPFVLVFATPAFCRTQTCGPMLDNVKAIAGDFPELTFINVEPYEMTFIDGRLQPDLADGQLQAAPWTLAWGLQTEPWIFVVDGLGVVTAKFEGAVAEEELRSAFSALQESSAQATGVVVAVDQQSVTDVSRFTLRAEDGEELVFAVGRLDLSDGGFNAGHLREHMAGASPVTVLYTEQDGERLATKLTDAE